MVETREFGSEIHSTARDISDRVAQQEAIARSEAEYRVAFESAPVAMAHIDVEGRYSRVNDALCELSGYRSTELVGKSIAKLAHPLDVEDVSEAMRAAIQGQVSTIRAERRLVRKDGTVAWVAVSASVVAGADLGVDHLLVHYLDITPRKELEEGLRHLADHDSLTDLHNHRSFAMELHNHVVRANRYEPTGALLLLDLDGFKQINDTRGHPAGDRVIIAVADHLRHRLRNSDVLARPGGDEFAVLLTCASPQEAGALADDLVRSIREEVVLLPDGDSCTITVSIGVAPMVEVGTTDEQLMAWADAALYEAKRAGRNCYKVFENPPVGTAPPVEPTAVPAQAAN
jgi:diguanylate cyclase (GGDEF)-like protein/PAS domain S-box-containing protein